MNTKAKGIHNGEVTHHQDQVIVPINLRTKKTINNTPPNPIPDEDDCELIFLF